MRLSKEPARKSAGKRNELEARDIIGPARPALRQLKEQLEDGDTLVVHMDDGSKLLVRLVR